MKYGKSNSSIYDIFKISVISLFSFLVIYLLGNGELCYFKGIFGIPCPGCGITRYLYYLIKLDIPKTFHYHPLFFLLFIIIPVVIFRNLCLFKLLYNSNLFWISALILILLTWIIRMFLYFPNIEPMTLNKKSMFLYIYYSICTLLE